MAPVSSSLTVLGQDRQPIQIIQELLAGRKPLPSVAQPDWATVKTELRAHPFEQRAVFYDSTDAVDGAVYCEWRDGEWRTEMELPHDEIVPHLIQSGAVVEPHEATFPHYSSSHQLDPGMRFSLDLHDAILHYVPHWSVGDEWGVEWEYAVTVTWNSNDHQTLVAELTEQTVKEEGIHEREFFVLTDRLGRDSLGTTHGGAWETEEETQARNQYRIALEKGLLSWRGKRLRRATRRDILGSGEYTRIKGAYFVPYYHKGRYETLFETSRRLARLGTLTVQLRASNANLNLADRAIREQIGEALQQKIVVEGHGSPYSFSNILLERLTRHTQVHTRRRSGRLTIPHEAPFSERGRLWVDGIDPEDAIVLFQELGFAGVKLQHVPDEALYNGRPHRRGRLTPPLPDFVDGAQLQLPKNTMVLHGLTGTERDELAERFRTICQAGGLLSIAERRRRGIYVDSMSPIGDIASGIDQGVSATISDEAQYGGEITFVMKPNVLTRRDVWFSDQDFGSSHNRYEQYNAYARSIGQERIWLPPSLLARARHLKYGIKASDNEVYLKHVVSLHEIDAVLVNIEVAQEIRRVAKELVQEGFVLPPIVSVRDGWDERKPRLRHPTVPEFVASRYEAWKGQITLAQDPPV